MIENVKSVLMLAALLMVGTATMISLRNLSEIGTLYFTTQGTILSTVKSSAKSRAFQLDNVRGIADPKGRFRFILSSTNTNR